MHEKSRAQAILIAGPTASGKSALAIRLARDLGGTVINADSMQVYDGLRVLTARPSPQDEALVPHRLYGHVPPHEAYSVGRYATDAAAALAAARSEGSLPIVVGGTGLYFTALLEGLSPIPAVPDALRAYWRGEAGRWGAPALHAELASRDPEMAARLQPTDTQRITRALEVFEATGRSLARWQELKGVPILDAGRCVRLVVAPDRAALDARCDARFDAMIASGALDEARAIASRVLDPGLPVMGTLGLQPLLDHLAGDLPLDDAVHAAKVQTRRYVKRQMTWLRRKMITWKWLSAHETESTRALDMAFIDA